MKRENKFLYGWKLYVNYGGGWEYETFEETRAAYLENRKAYAENCTFPQRWTRGRETNPNYPGKTIDARIDELEAKLSTNDYDFREQEKIQTELNKLQKQKAATI